MISKLNLFKNLKMDYNNTFHTYVTPYQELLVKIKSCEQCKHKQKCSRYISYRINKPHSSIKPSGCFNYHQSDDDVYVLVKYRSMKYSLLTSYIW